MRWLILGHIVNAYSTIGRRVVGIDTVDAARKPLVHFGINHTSEELCLHSVAGELESFTISRKQETFRE